MSHIKCRTYKKNYYIIIIIFLNYLYCRRINKKKFLFIYCIFFNIHKIVNAMHQLILTKSRKGLNGMSDIERKTNPHIDGIRTCI